MICGGRPPLLTATVPATTLLGWIFGQRRAANLGPTESYAVVRVPSLFPFAYRPPARPLMRPQGCWESEKRVVTGSANLVIGELPWLLLFARFRGGSLPNRRQWIDELRDTANRKTVCRYRVSGGLMNPRCLIKTSLAAIYEAGYARRDN